MAATPSAPPGAVPDALTAAPNAAPTAAPTAASPDAARAEPTDASSASSAAHGGAAPAADAGAPVSPAVTVVTPIATLAGRLLDAPPWRLSGTVIAALLNDPQALVALGDAVHQPPHKAPPQGPVLAVRPRNALAANGQAIALPADVPAVRSGPSLGIVIGRTACRVPRAQALSVVAGYLVANDLSLPLTSHYRPAVRQMARDGFCPLGQVMARSDQIPDPDALAMQLLVDGQTVWRGSTAGRVRGVAELVSAVSDFMTLQAGDVLLLGIPADAPLARAGQTLSVLIDGIGALHNPLVVEAA